jgi:hypothetical protein
MPNAYPSYRSHWDNFKDTGYDLQWISDVTRDPNFDVGFTYTEDDVRKNLNFKKEGVSRKHYWNAQGNRTILWFYAHFRMMNYYISNPNYDYYWFFDDDVRADNWVEFFKGFENVDDDFISYFIFKHPSVETQPNVPKINSKTHSGEGWFNRFPGDGDELPNNCNEIFGSFFPVVRYSKRAMEELVKINNQGYSGYSEGFVPTVLNSLGYKISSLINSDDTSNYYDVDKVNLLHKNIRTTWSWI